MLVNIPVCLFFMCIIYCYNCLYLFFCISLFIVVYFICSYIYTIFEVCVFLCRFLLAKSTGRWTACRWSCVFSTPRFTSSFLTPSKRCRFVRCVVSSSSSCVCRNAVRRGNQRRVHFEHVDWHQSTRTNDAACSRFITLLSRSFFFFFFLAQTISKLTFCKKMTKHTCARARTSIRFNTQQLLQKPKSGRREAKPRWWTGTQQKRSRSPAALPPAP